VNNTFYKLSREQLDKALKQNKISLSEAIVVVEKFYSGDAIERLNWSLSLRAHQIIEKHC